MFFDNLAGLARIALAAFLAYAWLVLVVRVAGKRSLAKLNAFDLVVTVALGSTLATVVLSKDVPLLEGTLAFVVLAAMQWAVSKLSISSNWFRHLIRSEPRLLFEEGRYREEAMAAERVTRSEVELSDPWRRLWPRRRGRRCCPGNRRQLERHRTHRLRTHDTGES